MLKNDLNQKEGVKMNPPLGNMEQIALSVSEASRLIHLSEQHIRDLCEARVIPAVKVGNKKNWRISYLGLSRWFEEMCSRGEELKIPQNKRDLEPVSDGVNLNDQERPPWLMQM